jgi:dolichol-phosphate mannosyltransferase
MRKLTSRVANYIASTVLSSNFSDLTGSFRIYKKQVFEELINETKTKGYSFQM